MDVLKTTWRLARCRDHRDIATHEFAHVIHRHGVDAACRALSLCLRMHYLIQPAYKPPYKPSYDKRQALRQRLTGSHHPRRHMGNGSRLRTPARRQMGCGHGARDRASPNFMGLAGLGLEIGIFCDFLYSVLLLSAVLGLDFLGLALFRPQVAHRVRNDERARIFRRAFHVVLSQPRCDRGWPPALHYRSSTLSHIH
jgi:hypothetical protein